jgi:hypothetical protein
MADMDVAGPCGPVDDLVRWAVGRVAFGSHRLEGIPGQVGKYLNRHVVALALRGLGATINCFSVRQEGIKP